MTETRQQLEEERRDLSVKLGAVEADIASIKAEMAVRLQGIQTDAQKMRTRLGQIDTEISRREAADKLVPTVSDHALLRYIERAHGIDIEALRAKVLTPSVVTAIKAGASAVKSSVGTMVIKGTTVVTFLDVDMRQRKKVKKGRYHEAEDTDDVD